MANDAPQTTPIPSVVQTLVKRLIGDDADKFSKDLANMVMGMAGGAIGANGIIKIANMDEVKTLGQAANLQVPNLVGVAQVLDKDSGRNT